MKKRINDLMVCIINNSFDFVLRISSLGIRQEMADIQKFLNSLHQWKKQTLENL